MKHLIETTGLNSLPITEYDRLILNSTKNEIIYRGGYEYVDLGLPSGLKWAKCNVGAEKETDYGDYFMWGSITPNTNTPCDWEHAPFNNGSSNFDSTYFNSVKKTVCPNGILAKEYDAARANMGGDWRMPTKAEIQELLDNTSNKWTQVNGVYGRKFTSKKNGNSIFIPASGNRSGSSFYSQGDIGFIWSSSHYTSYTNHAWYLNLSSYNISILSDNRFYGYVVRGVRK